MPHFVHDEGDRAGWLYNYTPSQKAEVTNSDGTEGAAQAAMQLFFYDEEGDTFEALVKYNPYFFVSAVEGHEREVELGLTSAFGALLLNVSRVGKEDLDLINHLSGKQKPYLKLSFSNTQDLTSVRSKVELILKRNKSVQDSNPMTAQEARSKEAEEAAAYEKTAWMEWVNDIREYDVKYYMRVAIDLDVYVGCWYDVNVTHGDVSLKKCDPDAYVPAMPRICAFDIETSKEPLKFPQPETDQIYMISYMLDQRGFLIVNREIVTEDIAPLEYKPKPEYETYFEVFNVEDEKALLRKWYDEMKRFKPNVYVTYNGDYFDFPFIQARSERHGMNLKFELGFSLSQDGSILNPSTPHLDCFYWVNRDSYLPQGSRGLKAVTKAKLGYDPVEVDPEDMLPMAQREPQKMANYSVSDAVATYGLYMKYVHPFIYSLCTIIPMPPDDVLRKGSGTLCESLLMVQAYAKNVVFPNKKVQQKEKFHNGRLIDSETYIGGHVEALQSGVFRSDIPMKFNMNPEAYSQLIDRLDPMLKFALENENGVKLEEVENYTEVRGQILQMLENLRDNPVRHETPLIYHLDVGAMYPNIILTNRLQPTAMVSPEICAGCCFNAPNNENQCRRSLNWIWRAELFTAGRHEYARVKAQLESESFQEAVLKKAEEATQTKQTYGKRQGNVLEGTAFDRKKKGPGGPGGGGGGGSAGPGGYRRQTKQQAREAREALIDTEGMKEASDESSGDDEDGKKFSKLGENQQQALLKKRLGEYCRKAYRKTHHTLEMMRSDTVCQRENSFYVDTVRLFRDRRYEYKRALKMWKGKLDQAKTPADVKEAKGRVVQMDSLQLAHKCILNSFYGYVMRKGSRWGSMEMAGIVTYVGATLITMARKWVQQIGVTLELDTDGIWCCLPISFPDNFTFKTSNPKKQKVEINYPCVMLNKDVHDHYTNEQYQDFIRTGEYKVREENSIYFEVDGPYLAMLLPAAREEGKSIKKRYAVFNPNGSLAELKGFELKRRGELMLIKDFQSLVFKKFLDGKTLQEAYASAAEVANEALDLLYGKGADRSEAEVVAKLTESSNMTRRLAEYPATQKSLALTTARRIAEFLGPQMVKDKGLACAYVISRHPIGKPVTERAIPLNILKADPQTKAHFLRKWTSDNTVTPHTTLQEILDWDYYIQRFSGTVQKIITIPAALQNITNPVPRIQHPDWLSKMVTERNSTFRQTTLTAHLIKRPRLGLPDIEDLGGSGKTKVTKGMTEKTLDDNDDGVDLDDGSSSDASTDVEIVEQRKAKQERDQKEKQDLLDLQTKYFSVQSKKQLDDELFSSPVFPKWLNGLKEQWVQRAKVRNSVQGLAIPEESSSIGAKLGLDRTVAGFVDAKAKALRCPWHILEVREDPTAAVPNVVIVFALLEGTLQSFRCLVDRTVYVDIVGDPTVFRSQVGGTVATGHVLPRHRTPDALVQVDLSKFKDGGERVLHQCRSFRDDVRGLYEGDLTLPERFISKCGCVLQVASQRHLANAKARPTNMQDHFHVDELEPAPIQSYLGKTSLRTVFLYHAAHDTRGLLVAIFAATSEALVVYVQPAGAQRPAIPWKTLTEDALRTIGESAGPTLNFSVQYANDIRSGLQVIQNALDEANSAPGRPQLAILQSASRTSTILALVPALTKMPLVRISGTVEDERIFASSPLTWNRDMSRRMLQRYFAAGVWIEERMNVAKVSGIPLGNLAEDTYISALDLMFMRALRRRSVLVWDRRDPAMHQPIDLQPTEVSVSRGYVTWAVELQISQLDGVAILFSQFIQEGDDPRAHVLSDGGITVHFHILRDMLSEIYSVALQRKEAAVALLLNVRRWLRDTAASSYEPQLVAYINQLVHRALATLLLRIKKVGGDIVRATTSSVIVDTRKLALTDALNFTKYLQTSLGDHPMLSHLGLRPVRYWGPQVVVDNNNVVGVTVDASQVEGVPFETLAEDRISEKFNWMVSVSQLGHFSSEVQQQLVARLQHFLSLAHEAKIRAIAHVTADQSVTLATRADRLQAQTSSALSHLLETELQPLVLEEVNSLVSLRQKLSDGRPTDLEYIKTLCHWLELMPGVDTAVRRTRNNGLRLCQVGAFAPAAQFTAPSGYRYHQKRTICSFCNEEIVVDLMSSAALWHCGTCGNPVDKEALEALLVQNIHVLLRRSLQKDLRCAKCKQPPTGSMQLLCTCGGSFIESKSSDYNEELEALRKAGVKNDLHWLVETVQAALAHQHS